MAKVTFTRTLFLIACLFAWQAIGAGQTPGTVRFPSNLDTSVSLLEVQDRASTTLSASISSGATTITVVSTTLFPSTGILTIDDERLYYTSKTATSFTVVRGQFGSSAATHASGAAVRMNVVARHHEVLRDSNLALQAKVGSSASLPTTTGHVLTVTSSGVTAWQAPSASAILPVADTQTIIKGSADATKLLRFEVDGFTTATTRVITPPDADTTLPIATQVLTFSGPTAARTITLPDANFTAVGLATTQSLTNKTLAGSTNILTPIDTSFTITGSADLTKVVRFEVDGFTTATTRVATMPDANIVIAGSASALVSGRLPYVTTGGLLADSANALLSTNGNMTLTYSTTDTGGTGLTVNRTANTTVNSTNTPLGLYVFYQSQVSAGVTDSGSRIGARYDIYAGASHSGTVTNFIGFEARAFIDSSSTATAVVSAAYGIKSAVFNSKAGAVITTGIGVYSDTASSQTITTAYDYVGNNASARNYLAGTLGVGNDNTYGQLWVASQSTTRRTAAFRAAASQTVSILELLDSTNAVLTAFNSSGALATFAGMADGTNIAVGTTTGTKIGTATTQKLSLWNATPIAQPSSTGQTAGYTANTTANILYDASTFTGGLGSTAYTIGDIVRHLKSFGLIAQ